MPKEKHSRVNLAANIFLIAGWVLAASMYISKDYAWGRLVQEMDQNADLQKALDDLRDERSRLLSDAYQAWLAGPTEVGSRARIYRSYANGAWR